MLENRCNRCANCAAVLKAQQEMLRVPGYAPVGNKLVYRGYDDKDVYLWNQIVSDHPCSERST